MDIGNVMQSKSFSILNTIITLYLKSANLFYPSGASSHRLFLNYSNVKGRHQNQRAFIPVQTLFFILLTVHHVMILGKWPTWRTILFYVFILNSLHVSSTSCSSSGGTNCINTTSGSCRWPCRKWTHFTSDLHTTRPPTQRDSYQRLYW
jgi:hypothetical protein